MILETVLAMCLLASGLGFGPSWDAVAWMQLSRTELVVEFERLSDQAVRRLRKAITSSVHVASAHMEIGVHLFAASAVTACMQALFTSAVCRVPEF